MSVRPNLSPAEVIDTPTLRRRALGRLAVVVLAGTFFVAGCGKADRRRLPLFPVKGQVLFEGRPVPGAWVVFHPIGADPRTPRVRGTVDKNGALTLTTYSTNDGAPAGAYVVTVEWRRVVGTGEDVQVGPNLLPRKYGNIETSGLHVCVAEGTTQLPPFQLRR